MRNRFFLFFWLLPLLAATLECGGGEDSGQIYPELRLSVTKSTVGPRGTAEVSAQPISGSAPPSITWTASSGALSPGTGSAVTFTAGSSRGDATISAQIPGDSHTYTIVVHVVPIQVTFVKTPAPADAPATFFLSVRLDPDQGDVTWQARQGELYPGGHSCQYTPPNLPGTYTVTALSTDDPLASASVQVTVNPQTLALVPSECFLPPWGLAQFKAVTTGIAYPSFTWTASAGTLDTHTNALGWWQFPEAVPGDYQVTVTSTINPSLSASGVVHVTNQPIPIIYVDMPITTVAPGGTLALSARTLYAADPGVTFAAAPDSPDPIPPAALDASGVLHAPSDPVRRSYRFLASSVQYPFLNAAINVLVNPRTWTPSQIQAGQAVQCTYSSPDAPGLTWSWALNEIMPGASVTSAGWYQSPPQAFFQRFTVNAGSAMDTFKMEVTGAGPLTRTAQNLPTGSWHAWVPRADGTVVIMGGLGQKDVLQVDPTTGAVTRLGEMKYFHYYGTAIDLGGDKVLMIGGDISGGTYTRPRRMEVFDLTQGRTVWDQVDDVVDWYTDRLILPDGRCLLGGIFQLDPNAPLQAAGVRVYDPATRTLGPVFPSPNGAHRPTLTMLRDGTVLVSGGYGLSGLDIFGIPRDAIYRLDPGTGAFTLLGHMNLATCYHTATELADGRILITGGRSENNTYGESGMELFDPATGTSQAAGSMAIPRMQHLAFSLDDQHLLLLGGADSGLLEMIDLTSGTMTASGSMFLPSYAPGAFLAGDALVLVASTGHLERAPVSALLASGVLAPRTSKALGLASRLQTSQIPSIK